MRADLAAMNIATDELDVSDAHSLEKSAAQISELQHYAFIVSFNCMGLDITVEGYSVSEFAKHRKVFVMLVDHPLHLLHHLIGSNVTVLCIDQEHVGFCQVCQINALYFPHAVAESGLNREGFIALENKKDEIIYPVSYFDLAGSRKKLAPVWTQIGDVLEQVTNVTRFLQVIGVLPFGSKAATIPLDENVRSVAIFADFYIRAKSRLSFLEECYKKNLRLTVIGNSSEKYQDIVPYHRYEKALPFNLLKERMRQAKFVAHNSPGFELGLHERIVTPLSLGTLPLASMTFLKQTFGDAVVSFDDTAHLKPSEYTDYLDKGYNKIAKEHTWRAQWTPIIEQL